MTENLESPWTESALALCALKQNSDKGPSYPECRPSADPAKWQSLHVDFAERTAKTS